MTIRVWNAKTGEVVGEPFAAHTAGVTSVAFSPDGTNIVSGYWDMTIRVWNVKTEEVVGEPFTAHTTGITSVAYYNTYFRLSP